MEAGINQPAEVYRFDWRGVEGSDEMFSRAFGDRLFRTAGQD